MFAKLQARYGYKWSSAYPPGQVLSCALDEWGSGLAGYTGSEIARGLDTWDSEWPPTLPEFKQACRQKRNRDLLHRPFPPALPEPINPMRKDRSLRKYLDNMRSGKADAA